MKRTTSTEPGLQTDKNGVTTLGGQYLGSSVTTPIATAFAASLASGAKVGGQPGGNGLVAWPAKNPGVA
jgi:hypothetical protein